MSLTKKYFDIALKFQNDRASAIEKYKNRMAEIETSRGSQFFDEESAKANSEMEYQLARLKEYAAEDFNSVLNDMRYKNNRRPMHAPTTEQANIVQLMKLKKNVTRDDLNAAANACKDSSLCLSVLEEIAQEKGVHGFSAKKFSDNTDLPAETVDKILDKLESFTNDFVASDRTRGARLHAERRYHLYGEEINELDLVERRRFNDEKSCFEEIANISGDVLTGLQFAVNM